MTLTCSRDRRRASLVCVCVCARTSMSTLKTTEKNDISFTSIILKYGHCVLHNALCALVTNNKTPQNGRFFFRSISIYLILLLFFSVPIHIERKKTHQFLSTYENKTSKSGKQFFFQEREKNIIFFIFFYMCVQFFILAKLTQETRLFNPFRLLFVLSAVWLAIMLLRFQIFGNQKRAFFYSCSVCVFEWKNCKNMLLHNPIFHQLYRLVSMCRRTQLFLGTVS